MLKREEARPLICVILVLALIGSAISESFGYPLPLWFNSLGLAYVSEWGIERAIRKGKTLDNGGE